MQRGQFSPRIPSLIHLRVARVDCYCRFLSQLSCCDTPPEAVYDPGFTEALDMETLTGILPVLEDSCLNGIIKPGELRAIYRDLLHLEQIEKIERSEFMAEQPVPAEEAGEGVEYIVRRRIRKSRGSR